MKTEPLHSLRWLVLLPTLHLCACASMPEHTFNYYLPSSRVDIKVVRSVSCSKQDYPAVVTTVTPVSKHKANLNEPRSFSTRMLDGAFSNSDLGMQFYPDGRLLGVNATSTGQGESILKSLTTFVAFAMVLLRNPHAADCKEIKSAGDGKPITLTYEAEIDLGSVLDGTSIVGSPQPIPPDLASQHLHSKIPTVVKDLRAELEVVDRTKILGIVADDSTLKGGERLKLRQPGLVILKVMEGNKLLWEGEVPASQHGKEYELVVPKAAAFGKQGFEVAIAESGAVTSVKYGKETGANQVLAVLNDGIPKFQGDSAATKAAEIKAEADLIFQQQRLAQCLADPATCK